MNGKWTRIGPKSSLIRMRSHQGREHLGVLFESDGANTTIVHVHGSCGNFASANFLSIMARIYEEAGINLLSVNTSGHDCISETLEGEELVYVGGSISTFEESVEDIFPMVEIARELGGVVILQGHSLGCDRVVEFVRREEQYFDLVLISPSDSYRLHEVFLHPGSVEEQAKRLEAMGRTSGISLLPYTTYGVRNLGEEYVIPVSRETLLSIIEGPPFRLFRIRSDMEWKVNTRCLACIGGRDDIQTWPSEVMFKHLESRFSEFESFVAEEGDHDFSSCEEALASRIVKWIHASS